MGSIYIFFVLLLIDWGLGFAVGWFSRGVVLRRSGFPLRPSAGQRKTNSSADGELDQLESLHAEVRRELSVHASALGDFERFLQTLLADSDQELVKSLSDQLRHVRAANQQVMGTLQRASGELSCFVRFCGQVLAKEQRQVDGYRTKTAQLGEVLSAVGEQSIAQGRVHELAAQVGDLQQENTHLRQELDDCQQELSAQMSAANISAANVRVDVVTQLPNRRAFEENLAELQAAFERNGEAYVVVFLDVDGLQQVNDQHGHAVGDAALAMLGRVFRENQRAEQQVSRFDGDQFALLLPACELESARVVAERYRDKVESASLRFSDTQVRTTASVGVARSLAGESRRGVVVRAEAALAAAKKAGGNQVFLHDGTDTKSPCVKPDAENRFPLG